MLIKKGYPNLLIDKVFKTESNRLKYIKPYGPEKCPVNFAWCRCKIETDLKINKEYD